MNSKVETVYSPKKESVLRELSCILGKVGIKVRREPLKRGPGWKALSGSCTLKGDPVVFVDRRLSQDEQISFLVSKIVSAKLPIDEASRSALPEEVLKRLVLE